MLAMKSGENDDRVTAHDSAASSSAVKTPQQIPRPKRSTDPGSDSAPRAFSHDHHGHRRYDILGEHGRGGLGRILRAHDRMLGRDVAIKELHTSTTADEARFLREVLITARLEHPGIVPIHEAGRWPDGAPYYAMKLVSGRPLRDLIAERTTFEQRIGLLHHVIAVADAIAYAHGCNIIHRDLKPSNIIVGDFGETVVIDWGLAKDLAATGALADMPVDSSGSLPPSTDSEVTVEGSVLGTPAYMAPEQTRGEAADQRADVFAIGAMLWQLCALPSVPEKAHLRQRMLRRAGIDKDLAAIINKALDPERERRYPDAGALAADLKAFKAGARITARDYSLLAMLAHWTRRHRTLALAATVVLATVIIGSSLFVRNIAIERDRADRSLDELTLKHAQLLLTTDPSAAVDALASYRGADRSRADQIRAEAVGRGVAFLRAQPHTDAITWTAVDGDGAILSLSSDGTIARTDRDGRSVILTRGVSKIAMSSYSRTRHLLAYTCDPSDLCLYDFGHATRTPLEAVLQGASVNGASFSPDGTVLAVLSKDGTLRLLDVSDPTRPAIKLTQANDATTDVAFVDDTVLVVGTKAGLKFVGSSGDSEQLPLVGIARLTTSASDHQVAIATGDGQAIIIQASPARIVMRRSLCPGSIAALRFIPGRRSIAYACREGAVGTWDLSRDTTRLRAQLEGHADFITTSPTGEYIVVGGNRTMTVIDLSTELVASYMGHAFRLLSITPPSAEHPLVVSADVRGAVRAWSLPTRFARVAASEKSPFQSAFFDTGSTTVTATTWLATLTRYSPATGILNFEPHELFNSSLERSSSGETFAAYGPEDGVEVWSSATMTRMRVIATGHGSVSQLGFLGDSENFVTSGHDGRLVRWTPAGGRSVLAQVGQPIDKFAMVSTTGVIVFSTMDGALWRTEAAGQRQLLRSPGSRVNRILLSSDHQRAYVGYATGEVVAIHLVSGLQDTLLRASGAVQEIVLTEDDATIAVATIDGMIHIGARDTVPTGSGAVTWTTWLARARDIALTRDGLLIASCTDGTIWLYSPHRQWLCLPSGAADLGKTVVAPDGKTAVVLDRAGRLLWIDLDAARKLLAETSQTPELR
jgi:serine/threonine protein kinase/WD40 repeat protein